MNWDSFTACLFDLDGVLTPTAEVHMRAWARMFNDYFESVGAAPYEESDYFNYLDGKPRYDGVASLLAARQITLPWGTPEDPDDAATVCGLGNRKDSLFNEVLADGIAAYPGSLRFLDFVQERGMKCAVVSSSKNARPVLTTAGIVDRFPVIVDGVVAAEQKLPGKPNPDTFQYAADQLGVPHREAVVFEDALSGVQAGAAGDFGSVVGVNRGTGAARLREAGADLVVDDLADLL